MENIMITIFTMIIIGFVGYLTYDLTKEKK
jgi:hypothetical protein